MRLRGVSSSTEKKNGYLYHICARWLVKNFGCRGSITNLHVLERSSVDVICGIVRVKFEFKGPNGGTGDGVAFLDQEEVVHARR